MVFFVPWLSNDSAFQVYQYVLKVLNNESELRLWLCVLVFVVSVSGGFYCWLEVLEATREGWLSDWYLDRSSNNK